MSKSLSVKPSIISFQESDLYKSTGKAGKISGIIIDKFLVIFTYFEFICNTELDSKLGKLSVVFFTYMNIKKDIQKAWKWDSWEMGPFLVV